MVKISRVDFERIVAYARSKLPEEACGLIAGSIDKEGARVVERVFFLENVDHSHEHFTIAPQAQLNAILEVRAAGLRLLGNWHSHPETPSRPSQEDIRLAADPQASYLILSLMDEKQPVLRAFRVQKGEARRDDLYIDGELVP